MELPYAATWTPPYRSISNQIEVPGIGDGVIPIGTGTSRDTTGAGMTITEAYPAHVAIPRKIIDLLRKLVSKGNRQAEGRAKLLQRIEHHEEGFPQLAAFLNSDEDNLIIRKFGNVHARLLLYRQDELAELERKLLAIDREDAKSCPLALKSRETDECRNLPYSRKSLMEEIEVKSREYHDLIIRMRSFVSLPAPRPRIFKVFATWMIENKPLYSKEMSFLEQSSDLITLAEGQERGWLDGVVESLLAWCASRNILQALSISPERRMRSDERYISLLTKYHIDVIVRLILTITTVSLLMLPSAVLYILPEHRALKIVLILLFTLLFSSALTVFTKAKRHEQFAATAAYCAVLVVFISNFPS